MNSSLHRSPGRLLALGLLLLLSTGCGSGGDPADPDVGKKHLQVYAHRGARSFAPENTIPGYDTGLAIGTHWVDMDVVMTRDGEVLVSHDIRLNPDIWRCLYELQKLDARVKTAYLTEWDNEPGTPNSFFDPDPAKAGLWTGGVLVKDHGNSIPQMVKDLGGTCWEPEDVELTKETLDEAHRLGLKVVVWTWPEHSGTVFDEALVSKLIDWGVDGIITDDPGRLISMLAARGYALPASYR